MIVLRPHGDVVQRSRSVQPVHLAPKVAWPLGAMATVMPAGHVMVRA